MNVNNFHPLVPNTDGPQPAEGTLSEFLENGPGFGQRIVNSFRRSQDADTLQKYMEAHADLETKNAFMFWGDGMNTEMNENERC